MRVHISTSFLYLILPFIVLFSALTSPAQSIINADSLAKNTFGWNQQEREFGFAHFDEVFNTHNVPKGGKVHKLPQAAPITAFSKGGQKKSSWTHLLQRKKWRVS